MEGNNERKRKGPISQENVEMLAKFETIVTIYTINTNDRDVLFANNPFDKAQARQFLFLHGAYPISIGSFFFFFSFFSSFKAKLKTTYPFYNGESLENIGLEISI